MAYEDCVRWSQVLKGLLNSQKLVKLRQRSEEVKEGMPALPPRGATLATWQVQQASKARTRGGTHVGP